MIDRAEIRVRAGDGGHGLISFRREKFVPRGGPDGGDGGHGGDVVLVVDPRVNGLAEYRHRRLHRAGGGGNGGKSKKHGKSGADIKLRVPPGTIVRRDDEVVADLTQVKQRFVAAKGGRGGRGNTHFSSPMNQAPHVSESGQRGEEATLVLELKLISDVGLVGMPNAGKSTLLAAVSRARPKIADYPFTTLEPNLGVVEVGLDSYVMADIPGLIEGAHDGAGLGLEFLRHVERTRLLIHVVDASRPDPASDIAMIDNELRSYTEALAERPQIIAFNKMDVPEADERVNELTALAQALARPYAFISAAARQGTGELARRAFQMLQRMWEEEPKPLPDEELPVLRPQPSSPQFSIEREADGYRVTGERPVMLVEMLWRQSDESKSEAMKRLRRMGIPQALRRAGVVAGDNVRFGEVEMLWDEE